MDFTSKQWPPLKKVIQVIIIFQYCEVELQASEICPRLGRVG